MCLINRKQLFAQTAWNLGNLLYRLNGTMANVPIYKKQLTVQSEWKLNEVGEKAQLH